MINMRQATKTPVTEVLPYFDSEVCPCKKPKATRRWFCPKCYNSLTPYLKMGLLACIQNNDAKPYLNAVRFLNEMHQHYLQKARQQPFPKERAEHLNKREREHLAVLWERLAFMESRLEAADKAHGGGTVNHDAEARALRWAIEFILHTPTMKEKAAGQTILMLQKRICELKQQREVGDESSDG